MTSYKPNRIGFAKTYANELMVQRYSFTEAIRMATAGTDIHPLELAGEYDLSFKEQFEALQSQETA